MNLLLTFGLVLAIGVVLTVVSIGMARASSPTGHDKAEVFVSTPARLR